MKTKNEGPDLNPSKVLPSQAVEMGQQVERSRNWGVRERGRVKSLTLPARGDGRTSQSARDARRVDLCLKINVS